MKANKKNYAKLTSLQCWIMLFKKYWCIDKYHFWRYYRYR